MKEFSLLEKMARQPKIVFEKIHPDAKLPHKSIKKDVGWDLYSIEEKIISPKNSEIVKVGLKLAYLDEGYWIKVESRSGLAFKNDIVAFQGVIDNQYRGEIGIKLFNFGNENYNVKSGDRIAQLVVYYENIDFSVEWGKITPSIREDKGFGSTGK
jgi:dUTP pyrophosphatase